MGKRKRPWDIKPRSNQKHAAAASTRLKHEGSGMHVIELGGHASRSRFITNFVQIINMYSIFNAHSVCLSLKFIKSWYLCWGSVGS